MNQEQKNNTEIIYKQVENILTEDMDNIFLSLDVVVQKTFKIKGEEIAQKITSLLIQSNIKYREVSKLIFEWFSIIPKINKYYIEQETKIKTDNIFKIVNKYTGLEVFLLKIPNNFEHKEEKITLDFIQNHLGRVENLFTALSGLKVQKKIFSKRSDLFSIEIVSIGGTIDFYITTPSIYKDFLIQQLQTIYPRISFEKTFAYNIFQPQGSVKIGVLDFANDYSLPIKTYRYFESDPFEVLINSFNDLIGSEAIAIQYVFRSAPKKWHLRGKKIARYMHGGLLYKDALKKIGGLNSANKFVKVLKFFVSFFTVSDKNKIQSEQQLPMSAMEQERARGMEEKTSKSALEVNIRVVVSTGNDDRSKLVLNDVLNSYSQYNIYEFGNSFKINIPKNIDAYIKHFIYSDFVLKKSIILNSEEMTSIVHLPIR